MKYTCFKPLSSQRGSAIVLALFIIVVLGFLAVSLIRLLSDSSRSVAIEVYSARAFLAAQSGADLGLATVFPLGQGEGIGACSTFTLKRDLEPNCKVEVQIECEDNSALDARFYYLITSEATCGAGTGEQLIDVARTIQVEARGLAL